MKYSINISSDISLKVCVGEYETFEEAKIQMTKFIVDLIANQRDDIDDWDNLKEGFPEEIQEILDSFEKNGTAHIDYEICDDYDDNAFCSVSEEKIYIVGKPNEYGSKLSIITNAVNMYAPDKRYSFTLIQIPDEGDRTRLAIQLVVNEESVEVYNMIPDDVRSRLEPVDLDDE